MRVGDKPMAATGAALPVPDRATNGGVVPLAATFRLAVRGPAAVGVNAKVTVQLLPTPKLPPAAHVPWPSAKSDAAAPDKVMAVRLAAALPLLVRVSVCPLLLVPTVAAPKSRAVLAGIQASTGANTTAAPVPVRAMALGEVLALLVMMMNADLVPTDAGEKTVLNEHELPAGKVAGQVWLKANSAELDARPASVRAAEPLLVSVMAFALDVVPTVWLPKDTLPLDKVTAGTGVAVPVPSNVMDALPLLALLAKVKVALRLPVADGVNVSSTLHVPPAAKGVAVPHVPARAKSLAAAPANVRPLKFSAAVPLLDTVTLCAVLVPPSTCEPKLSAVALRDKVAVGAALPVPFSVTVLGEFAAL